VSGNSGACRGKLAVCSGKCGFITTPPAKRKADASERVRDTELSAVLSKTEIMILNFHQSWKLSQRWGQALLSMVRHPQFNPAELLNCKLCAIHGGKGFSTSSFVQSSMI
jgi:hypothetical protein